MRRRVLLLRALAVLFAVSWIVFPGFGAIDLSVTWDPEWEQVLEAGWGLYFTVIVGVPFVVAAVRPRASRAGVAQLTVATAVLAISAVVAQEIGALVLAGMLGLETAVVAWLARRDWPPTPEARVSRVFVALAAVGALPWLAYALDMWDLNRREVNDTDITNGVDHYSVQGGVGLALAVLPATRFLPARAPAARPRLRGRRVRVSRPRVVRVARRRRWLQPSVVGGSNGVGRLAGRRGGSARRSRTRRLAGMNRA